MNGLFEIGLVHFLVVGALVFALGVLTVATRRNAVAILIAVFIIVLAAAEAAIALAIVLAIFRSFHTIDAAETSTLRE
jgi:NADH-quinone oxidoreductase subunit K